MKSKRKGEKLLGWPRISFGFFHKMLQKNLNKLFGQPNVRVRVCVFLSVCGVAPPAAQIMRKKPKNKAPFWEICYLFK